MAIQRLRTAGIWIPADFVLATEAEIDLFVADVRALQEDVSESYKKRMKAGIATAETLYAEGKFEPDIATNYEEPTLEDMRNNVPDRRPWIARRVDEFVYAKFFKDEIGQQVVHYLRVEPGQDSDYDEANHQWNSYRRARYTVVNTYLLRHFALTKKGK